MINLIRLVAVCVDFTALKVFNFSEHYFSAGVANPQKHTEIEN